MLAFYIFSLVLGGGFLLLSLFGDFLEADADVDAHVDFDGHVDADFHGAGAASKLLSIRGLIYGLFGFGGVGTLMTVLGAGGSGSIAVFSTLGGLLSGALISMLFAYVKSSASGERKAEDSYVGLAGRVILPIQSGSAGQIDILRGDRTYRLRALPHGSSHDDDPSTWRQVVVIEMRDGVARVVPGQDLLASG